MATECPLNCKPRRSRRWLSLLLVLLLGLSVPFSVYWSVERTERRIRATERMLMEELALVRAEVAALSYEQSASQEAVEQLMVRTEAVLELWEAQVDRLAAIDGPDSQEAMSPAADGTAVSSTLAVHTNGLSEDEPEEESGGKEGPFWVAWWAGATYYAMKVGRYLPSLSQLARLHPAIP